jgi:hypothetical protein
MLSLGEIAIATGGEATNFLQHVQKEHPADFWANLTVGNALCQSVPQDAVGYHRARSRADLRRLSVTVLWAMHCGY